MLLYLDPARSRGGDDEHGRVSRLVMKCHQREQAEGKDELCNDFFTSRVPHFRACVGVALTSSILF